MTIFSVNHRMFIYMVWISEMQILIQLLKYIWLYNVNIEVIHSARVRTNTQEPYLVTARLALTGYGALKHSFLLQ